MAHCSIRGQCPRLGRYLAIATAKLAIATAKLAILTAKLSGEGESRIVGQTRMCRFTPIKWVEKPYFVADKA
jgi:hypothetical protein